MGTGLAASQDTVRFTCGGAGELQVGDGARVALGFGGKAAQRECAMITPTRTARGREGADARSKSHDLVLLGLEI